ncbi:MAG: hypothetical protein LBB48_09460 [Treponema sp.]|jgi:hypothetical protein|nr:hypothetical protein [Treponema sp.]
MEILRMKKLFFLALLLIIPALCFAADYYAEYSFAEADKIDSDEIRGINGQYSFVFHWTKAEIQDLINEDSQTKNHRTIAEYMSRMLRASVDKRIFIMDAFNDENGSYGWLFIKINENEYVVFFTGV